MIIKQIFYYVKSGFVIAVLLWIASPRHRG
jgi:hypothetical protein